MTNHFAYLVDDDASEFFFDAMVDSVQSSHRSAHEKVASDFEKVAAQVGRDLEFLKTAGACGWGLGMIKRADAYIDLVVDRCQMSSDEFGAFFDKVASEAIMTDLEAARAQAYAEHDDIYHPLVDIHIAKLGHELTSLAAMEKEAGIMSAVRGLTRWGEGARAATAFRAGEAARAVGRPIAAGARRIARPIASGSRFVAEKARGAMRAVSRVPRKWRQHKIVASQRELGALQSDIKAQRAIRAKFAPGTVEHARATARLRSASRQAKKLYGAGGKYGIRGSSIPLSRMTSRQLGKSIKQMEALRGVSRVAPEISAESRYAQRALKFRGQEADTLIRNHEAEVARAARAQKSAPTTVARAAEEAPASQPKTPLQKKTTQPTKTPAQTTAAQSEAKSISVEQQRREAASSARRASNEPFNPPKLKNGKNVAKGKKGKKGKKGAEVNAGPKAPPEVTVNSAFRNLQEKGWKNLSPEERSALIRAGVVGAAGYRMVTGHGAVTGGQGII